MRKQPVAAGDPELARALYHLEVPWYDWWTSRFQYLRSEVVALCDPQPGDVAVDAGCGTGLAFAALEGRVGPTGRVIGVDLCPGMLAVARERVACHGWQNVELVEATAEEAQIPGPVDGFLFCATHDILQSLNLEVFFEHAPFVTTFEGFARPWAHLEALLEDVAVHEVLLGTGYLMVGRTPGG